MSSRAVALFVLAACSYAPSRLGGDAAADASVDDGPATSDLHLSLTEILAEGPAEFIEIHNPTGAPVDLTNYYLTDVNEYWKRPSLPDATVTVVGSDFLVKFPDGATIAAGEVIVIASDGTAFQATFSKPPTYTIAAGGFGISMIEIVTPQQPAMLNKLTDDGELVVLFEWDGQRDLVRDVDIVVHGLPTTGNQLIAKQPVDGPDADTLATAYAVDSLTASMADRSPDNDQFSYKRLALEATQEAVTGGNGITGHDETSENLQVTWDTGSMPTSPGTVSLP